MTPRQVVACFTLFALALCPAAWADPPARLSFRFLGTDEGLANLSVEGLAEDGDGFLWIGTDDGLYRFDGNELVHFNHEDGLPSSRLTTLARGPRGGVWVGTTTGVGRVAKDRIEAYGPGDGLPPQWIHMMVAAPDRMMWIAGSEGLYQQIGPTRFKHADGWPQRECRAVWIDPDGRVFAADGNDLMVREGGGWRRLSTESGLGRERVDAIVRDGSGTLWVRSPHHLWSCAPDATVFRDQSAVLPGPTETAHLLVDHRGALWVPAAQGIAIHSASGWKVLGPDDGLPAPVSRLVYEDREGSIWIASAGLYQMRGRGLWRGYTSASGFPASQAWVIRRMPDHRLWVGTDRGLLIGDDQGWRFLPGTTGRFIRAFDTTPDGALWLGGIPAELLRRDPVTGAFEKYGADAGLRAERVLSMKVDHEGTLWVATLGGGLYRLEETNGSRRFVPESLPGGFAAERLSQIVEDRAGRLWVAGERGLAMRANGRWTRFTRDDGLRDTPVSYLAARSNGEVCVVYSESLGATCFAPRGHGLGGLWHLNTSTGLTSDKIYAIGEDAFGRLWLGQGNGVDVFDGTKVEHFSHTQGLVGDDTAATAFWSDPGGDIFLGNTNGLGRFAAAEYEGAPPLTKPVMVVARLGKGVKVKRGEEPVAATPGNTTFEVEFTSPAFIDSAHLEYQARLLPIDSEWRDSKANQERFSDLSPGDYTFEVRSRIVPRPWGQVDRLSFHIEPRWWQTWWCRLLGVLAGLALSTLLVRWRARVVAAERTKEIVARSEANFRTLIEQNPDTVFVVQNSRFIYVNRTAVERLGYASAEELLQVPPTELAHPEERADAVRALQTLDAGQSLPLHEWRLLKKDGTAVPMEVLSMSIEFDGAPAQLVIGRDITERKQLEGRLMLSDRMASIGTLAAGVAHEINNPLAYITANLDMVSEELGALELPGTVAKEVRGAIEDSREGARRVRKIVSGLKSFSRAESEARRPVDLHSILELSLKMTENEVRHRARVVRDDGPVPLVVADEARLGQVFVNLLVNAAQAIKEGNAEANRITVVTRTTANGQALVEIRDTGSGISEAVRKRIFDPFFTTKRVGEGTGLGLSICHGIVSSLGGEITVESEVGKGTTFSVTLPPATSSEQSAVAASPVVAEQGARGRVLVVDDDVRVGAALRRALVPEHEVTVVTRADDAVAEVSTGRRFDVILSDLMMPQMTGMDLHEVLKRKAPDQAGRMVFITGGAFSPSAQRFLDEVPNERLEKPFQTDQLRALIRRLSRAPAIG